MSAVPPIVLKLHCYFDSIVISILCSRLRTLSRICTVMESNEIIIVTTVGLFTFPLVYGDNGSVFEVLQNIFSIPSRALERERERHSVASARSHFHT